LTTGENITTDAVANPDSVITEDSAMEAIWDRVNVQNGADRGDGGKFTSPAAAEGAQGGSPEGEGAVGAQPSPVVGVAVPAHLPQAIKTDWDKIPETARNEIAKLSGEWDRKFGEVGAQLKTAKPIADKIMGAAQQFDAFKGMSPEQIAEGAISLAGVQAALMKSPESAVSMIVEVAKTYNVLPQLAKVFGQQGDGNQLVTGLQQQIANLENQLSQVGNPDTIRETVSMTLKERETETLVQSFAANEGKDYWPDVEASMPTFIKAVLDKGEGKAPKEIIADAYDMAINALPDVRAKVRASEAKVTAAQPDPKRTEAAKRAASINVPSGGVGKERQLTEDELYGAAYDRKMAS
jgi:hypothetical protein